MPKGTTFTVRVSEDLKRALQDLAQKDRRTFSAYVELVLDRHVADATADKPSEIQRQPKPSASERKR